jgi:hypothetical protein
LHYVDRLGQPLFGFALLPEESQLCLRARLDELLAWRRQTLFALSLVHAKSLQLPVGRD